MQSPGLLRVHGRRHKSAQLSSAAVRDNSNTAFHFSTSLGPPAPIYAYNRQYSVLPLDILSIIIGYLSHSPADLASMSRVSRVMHYLTTPLLYREVHLRSWSTSQKDNRGQEPSEYVRGKKRKREDEDVGREDYIFDRNGDCGTPISGKSPQHNSSTASHVPGEMSTFLVGLATLQRPTVSRVVKKLVFEGELECSSFSSSGSVMGVNKAPKWTESDGMFGLAIGGTVGALVDLQELSWKLQNAYIHPLLWYSLARHPTLNTLTYVCPPTSNLPPQSLLPRTNIPMFQNLTSLSVLDIDGSHPPDDFSRVVFGHSAIDKLKTLRLSWVNENGYEKQKGVGGGGLGHIFGAKIRSLNFRSTERQSAITKLRLRKLEIMNLYIPPGDLIMENLFDPSTIEFLSYLNCSIFESWPTLFSPPVLSPANTITPSPGGSTNSPPVSTSTGDSTTSSQLSINILPSLTTLRTDSVHPQTLFLLSHTYHLQNIYFLSPPIPPTRPVPIPIHSALLKTIHTNHLTTLHRLLLPPHLILSKNDCSKLMLHSKSTLTELGFACDKTQWGSLAILVPFVQSLACFRLLRAENLQKIRRNGLFTGSESEVEKMERRMGDGLKLTRIKIIGVGDNIWRIDSGISIEPKKKIWGGSGGIDGNNSLLPSERVKNGYRLEELIWEMQGYVEEEGGEMGGDDERGFDGLSQDMKFLSEDVESRDPATIERILKQLDEEFMKRETKGVIAKKKSQKISKEDALEWGIIREEIYGLAR